MNRQKSITFDDHNLSVCCLAMLNCIAERHFNTLERFSREGNTVLCSCCGTELVFTFGEWAQKKTQEMAA